MSATIEELKAKKQAVEAELATALAQVQQPETQAIQSRLDEIDPEMISRYEENLLEIEEIIGEVNYAYKIIENQLKRLKELYKANGAKLLSGRRMRSVFAVPQNNYHALDYSLPYFEKQGDRFVFQKKNNRLLS